MQKKQESDRLREEFIKAGKKHILMITNHGIHQWDVITSLPDTGGQNVYVNQLTDVLKDFGYKITIVNRGGYRHPQTDELRTGFRYKNAYERIFYVEDSTREFVRKEDMKEQIPELVESLYGMLENEQQQVDVIMSHYWDAALMGVKLNEKFSSPVPHLWIPHSLGAVKKRNMPPETWEKLRVDERIATEKEFIGRLDYVAATSSLIRDSLRNDYGREMSLFLPPCVNPQRFFPREIKPDHEIWDFLSKTSGVPKDELQKSRFITEISRTDQTKRKDVLIRAFGRARKKHPDIRLIISIDQSEEKLYKELTGLIDELGLKDSVIVLGHEAARLPFLYALTAVYCSPSIMEGFGMSVQEAAATAVPVIGSDKIPFVDEYLLSDEYTELEVASPGVQDSSGEVPVIKTGAGGIVVPSDSEEGFTQALLYLLENEERRAAMGRRALDITVPYFTWDQMTRRLLDKMGMNPDE